MPSIHKRKHAQLTLIHPRDRKQDPAGSKLALSPAENVLPMWLRRSLTSSNNAAISHPNRGLRGIGRGAEVRSAGEGEYLRHGGGQGTGANGKRSFASGGGRSPAQPSKVRIWGTGGILPQESSRVQGVGFRVFFLYLSSDLPNGPRPKSWDGVYSNLKKRGHLTNGI